MKTKLAKRDYLVISTSEVRFPFVTQVLDWHTFEDYCNLLNSLIRENVKWECIDVSGKVQDVKMGMGGSGYGIGKDPCLIDDEDVYWAIFYVGRLPDALRLLRDGTCQDLR